MILRDVALVKAPGCAVPARSPHPGIEQRGGGGVQRDHDPRPTPSAAKNEAGAKAAGRASPAAASHREKALARAQRGSPT